MSNNKIRSAEPENEAEGTIDTAARAHASIWEDALYWQDFGISHARRVGCIQYTNRQCIHLKIKDGEYKCLCLGNRISVCFLLGCPQELMTEYCSDWATPKRRRRGKNGVRKPKD